VVTIVSPIDGAVVGTTFEVRVTAPHTCYCDTCGCVAENPFTTTLRIDGSSYDNCNGDGCDTSDHTFVVKLPAGTYQLDAAADHDLAVEFSEKIMVTVEGESTSGDTTAGADAGVTVGMTTAPPTTGNGGSSSGTGDAAASDGGSTGGCGCRAPSNPSGPLGALLSVLVLGTLRRRRS
jgi:MYXO-CTERM domain-containing protein